MEHGRRQLGRYALAGLSLWIAACSSPGVLVPPRVEIRSYERVALISFTAEADPRWSQLATQHFMQSIQSAQPRAGIVELGPAERVLSDLGRESLDFETAKAIGSKYRVDAIFTGDLQMSEVSPKLNVSQMLTDATLRATIDATLTARLIETQEGATIWTDSARGQVPVAHLRIRPGGTPDFGAADPETASARLVQSLADRITRDFRPRYEKR